MKKLIILVLLFAIFLIGCKRDTVEYTNPKTVINDWEISKTNYDFYINSRDLFFVDSEIGFVVGYNGAIYKTVNAGKSWTKQNSGTTLHLYSIFFLNKNIGFAAGRAMSGCLDEDCGHGSIILKTSNGGETWTKIFFKDYTGINSLKFFNETKGVAIIETPEIPNSRNRYIATTSDGGNTWHLKNLEIFSSNNKIECVDNILFVAGENQRIYKSKDFGNSWETINTPISVSDNVGNIYFYDENIGFIDGGTTIYKTSNGGLSWEATNFPFPSLGIFHFYSETEGFNLKTVFVYDGGDFPTFKGSIVCQTSNGGKSWNKSELLDSLFIGLTYFPQKDLGYGINGSEFYTFKMK
jgi:photosystem II stability/assembly factor-like uncharacterized protein